MKRIALVLMLLFILMVTTAKAYELEWCKEDEAIVLAQNINVRKGPSTRETKVTTKSADTVLKIRDELDEWYRIKEGYVRRRYVTADFGYIYFSNNERPEIRSMPFDVAPLVIEPEDARGRTYTVIGEYGNWFKLKVDKGTGFVRKRKANCLQNPQEDCYTAQVLVVTKNAKLRAEPSSCGAVLTTLKQGSIIDVSGQKNGFYKVYANGMYGYIPSDRVTNNFSKLIAYGTVFLKTDPETHIDKDGAAVGEWSKKVFTVIGQWQDYWVVLYGEGSALIKNDSLVFSKEDIEYYYTRKPTYGIVVDETKMYGKDGKHDFGTLECGDTVKIVGQDGGYYIIKCKFQNEKCIAWVDKESVIAQ